MSYSRFFSNLFAALLFAAGMLLVARAFAHEVNHGDARAPVAAAEPTPFGMAGDPGKISRTVAIEMDDAMRFSPASVTVKRGETVRFVVHNRGRLFHEMVIGTTADLQTHAKMMREMPDMAHDAPYIAHVSPSHTETLVWHFNVPGEFQFACLMPGHAEAGMTGRISVR